MTKSMSAAAAFLGLIAGLAPVGAGAKTICFVTFSLQIAYFQSSVAGGEKAAKDLGIELIVLDPQADAARQVTQVEDCISREVDAIVVDPIESSSLIGALEEVLRCFLWRGSPLERHEHSSGRRPLAPE